MKQELRENNCGETKTGDRERAAPICRHQPVLSTSIPHGTETRKWKNFRIYEEVKYSRRFLLKRNERLNPFLIQRDELCRNVSGCPCRTCSTDRDVFRCLYLCSAAITGRCEESLYYSASKWTCDLNPCDRQSRKRWDSSFPLNKPHVLNWKDELSNARCRRVGRDLLRYLFRLPRTKAILK